MKIIITIILGVLLLASCQTITAPSYEEGLTLCVQSVQEKHPDLEGFFPQSPDCLVGHLLPEIDQETIDGVSINQAYFKDKMTIVNFWFSGCAPCMAEIPGFNKIVERFGTDHVNYLAIGRDTKDEITQVLKYTPWKFEQIADGNKLIKETFKLKWGYPTTFVVNEKAEIIHAFSGGSTGEEAIQRIQDEIIPLLIEELK